MNLNELIEPLGRFMVWTFDTVIVPIGNSFNYFCVVLGFIGLFIWLKMQVDYNRKAKEQGTIA